MHTIKCCVNVVLLVLSHITTVTVMTHEEASPQQDLEHPLPPGPEVHFEHVASLRRVSFRGHWEHTLKATWREAYEKLEEEPRVEDRLQTFAGTDVMPFLDKKLGELDEHEHETFKDWRFQIVGPTGGA